MERVEKRRKEERKERGEGNSLSALLLVRSYLIGLLSFLLGLYSKTLATLEESSATRLDPHSLINFEKLRGMYRVVDEIKRYQSVRYEYSKKLETHGKFRALIHFAEVHYQIRSALKSLPLFSDDQLSIVSQSIMPRESQK